MRAHLRLRLAIAATLALTTPISTRADEPSFRDLVRKFVQSPTVAGAKIPGLPDGVEKIVALEYTVLRRTADGEEAVDASAYRFKIGDQIRVRIKPLSGLYIYIFHEGASGKRVCLLPENKEQPPLAKPEQSLELPADGSVFEFSPPAGDEKLIVVAMEKPSENLAALSDVIFKKPEDALTPAEKKLRDEVKARSEQTLKSILERQAQGIRYRGLFTEEALAGVSRDARRQGTSRVAMEEPPQGKRGSTLSMVALLKGENAGELYVTIPLKSTSK